MKCSCSPDIGDCQRCHPEQWVQRGGSFSNWIPKDFKNGQRSSKSTKRQSPYFNRIKSKAFPLGVKTRKKRTV
jgi:hypothetical protein